MRIKIGNVWYEVEKDRPIMIELTEQDKWNIENMSPDATKYAIFPENFGNGDEMLDWME